MPVKRVGREATLTTSVVGLYFKLFLNQLLECIQAGFRPTFFRLLDVQLHQFVEPFHRRILCQLAGEKTLRHGWIFMVTDNVSHHKLG